MEKKTHMSLMDRDYYWEDRDKKNKRQTNIMRIRKKSRVNKKAVFFFAFLIAFLAVIGYVDNYGIPQTVLNTLSSLGIDISEADIKDLKSSYDGSYWEEDTYNEIYNGIVNYQTNISLSIPYTNQNSDIISRQYKRVIDEHPELFWLDGSGKCAGTIMGNVALMNIEIGTLCDINSVPQMKTLLDKAVTEIIFETNKRCKTDFEKAEFVHDVLIMNCEYDAETYYRWMGMGDDRFNSAHTSYGCLVNRKAVCAGYAKAYMLIMNELGIECGYVEGTAGTQGNFGPHAWNYIKLDDGYYMVDLTWDDPIGNSSGNIYHNYFCVNTETISKDHTIGDDQVIPLCEGVKYLNN